MLENNLDQFERLASMARSQEDYLQGVIEFFQTRTNTKMTVAAERLAVIAAVTLPVTALSSVMGMNVIVNSQQRPDLRRHPGRGHGRDGGDPADLGQAARLVVRPFMEAAGTIRSTTSAGMSPALPNRRAASRNCGAQVARSTSISRAASSRPASAATTARHISWSGSVRGSIGRSSSSSRSAVTGSPSMACWKYRTTSW